MGGVVKAVKGVISGPEKVKPITAKKSLFDISKEVKPAQQNYAPLVQGSKDASAAVAPQRLDVLKQMGLAATGKGPSLAEAQLKAAQDRNLAQQLAAVQATRSGNSALNQRTLLQNMGASGRQLAHDAATARLQERDSFLNAANTADQALRTDTAGQLNLDLMPKQSLQAWEQQRVGAANQAQQANAAAQNQMTGALLGGASSVLGGYLSKKDGGQVSKKDMAKCAEGGQVPTPKYKKGGNVEGPGTETSDSIPTLLSDKEFVVRAKVAKEPAMLKFLKKANSGKATEKDAQALAKFLAKKGKGKA